MVTIGLDILKGLYNCQPKKGETYEFVNQNLIAKKWYIFAVKQLFNKCRVVCEALYKGEEINHGNLSKLELDETCDILEKSFTPDARWVGGGDTLSFADIAIAVTLVDAF